MPNGSTVKRLPAFSRSLLFLFAVLLACVFAKPVKAQIPDVVITVGDTVGESGEQNSVITVKMDNIKDTVVALELWLRLSRTNILIFQTDTATIVDTLYWDCTEYVGLNCVDSIGVLPPQPYDFIVVDTNLVPVGNINTTGSLLSNWEYIDARSLLGNGLDIKVTGIADALPDNPSLIGIFPQFGGTLFQLLGDVQTIPDTLTDRIVYIIPQTFKDHLNFSRPDGTSIGIVNEFVPDSNFYRCTAWLPPDSVICLNYVQVQSAPYDSLFVGLDTLAIVDTVTLKLLTGSLTVTGGLCGNIDGDPANQIDISDLTFLVGYLFLSGPAPDPIFVANVDCVGEIDIADLTTLVDHLFINNTPLCCGPQG